MGRIELRECPFCGYIAEFSMHGFGQYSVKCVQCHATRERYQGAENAALAWNTRAYDAALTAQQSEIERLKKDYDRINDFENSQCVKLLAKLNTVERERDALVEALQEAGACDECKKWQTSECGYADNIYVREDGYYPFEGNDCFEWRDLPGKGEEA